MSKRELVVVALGLVLASAALYAAHYALFHDAHHIFIYMVGDIAFLPFEVLFVTLILDRLLSERERLERRRKLNMVIGTFFSAMGYELLRLMGALVADRREVFAQVAVDPAWGDKELREAAALVCGAEVKVVPDPEALGRLRDHLVAQREFGLRLLENPTLLEHEEFTDMLWAVSHLAEELQARGRLEELPESDLAHLASDVRRAWGRVLVQWLSYMVHLQHDYPYLYSFAARTNPLREGARPEAL